MTNEVNIEEQLAQYAAEDAKAAAEAKAQRDYDDLVNELYEIGRRVGVDLADANADHDNAADAGYAYGTVEFWEVCLSSAQCAAGFRAEDAGLDINALIGRTIY